MSIINFIPELWSREILLTLRKRLIFGALCNRDYEGDIAQVGDTVHIVSFADPSISDYAKYGTITWEELTDSELALTVDQAKSFSFKVDDIDRKQAIPGFVETATRYAAYGLANAMDSFVSGLMAAGVDAGNELGPVTVASNDDGETAYALLLDLRGKLVKAGVPDDGRWVSVPTDFYNQLLKDNRFVRSDAAPGATVQSGMLGGASNADIGDAPGAAFQPAAGYVGRALGFNVFESQTLPEASGVYTVIAGHNMATTLAEQIVETEAIRLIDIFGDGVRGLHVYGGKVVRPTSLATAEVTVS